MEQLSFFQFFEEVVNVRPAPVPRRLHCPVCDYYFNNNPDFYKYCHVCGSLYEVSQCPVIIP